jgi:hypothetical protein
MTTHVTTVATNATNHIADEQGTVADASQSLPVAPAAR